MEIAWGTLSLGSRKWLKTESELAVIRAASFSASRLRPPACLYSARTSSRSTKRFDRFL